MPERLTPDELIYELIDSSIAAGIDYIRATAKKQTSLTEQHLYNVAADKLLEARKAMKVAHTFKQTGEFRG